CFGDNRGAGTGARAGGWSEARAHGRFRIVWQRRVGRARFIVFSRASAGAADGYCGESRVRNDWAARSEISERRFVVVGMGALEPWSDARGAWGEAGRGCATG